MVDPASMATRVLIAMSVSGGSVVDDENAFAWLTTVTPNVMCKMILLTRDMHDHALEYLSTNLGMFAEGAMNAFVSKKYGTTNDENVTSTNTEATTTPGGIVPFSSFDSDFSAFARRLLITPNHSM